MTQTMQGFPPPSGAQVTLANWRLAPFNRWAFHHVREILPTADIANDPFDIAVWAKAPVDTADWRIDAGAGSTLPFAQYLEASATDAIAIVHRGRLVYEWYAPGNGPATAHILMSVSKSMLALVAGILAGHGELDLSRDVATIVPELGATAYAGATVRQLLDMRSGVAFDEDYSATSGPIVEYRKSTGWNPLAPAEEPSDLRSFYRALTASEGPHGGRFHYVSPNSDLLGWVIERATGTRFADLASELLWQPSGASRSAYITVDRFGAPRCAGGMCICVRDLALIGQLLVAGGARGGKQVVPAAWIDDVFANGDRGAWEAGSFVDLFSGRPMHYRSQWYVEHGLQPLLFGLGIHGQNLYVDPTRQIVVAKLSSQAAPLDPAGIEVTRRAIDAIAGELTALA